MRKPIKKFIREPAASTMKRCHRGLAVKARGSSLSPSSPSMAQKPPMGRARRLYSVSPFFRLNRVGPMPMEYSFTRMPKSLAALKCPSSWTAMSTPNMRMPIRI